MGWIREHQTVLKKIGIIAGVILGMKYLAPLLIPFFAAWGIVWGSWPLLGAVKRRLHIRPAYTMAALILAFVALAVVLGFGLGKGVAGVFSRVSELLESPEQVESLVEECCEGIAGLLHVDTGEVQLFLTEQMEIMEEEARKNALPEALLSSWQALKGFGSFLAALLVTLVSTLLLAADFEKIREAGRAYPAVSRGADLIRGLLKSVGGYLRAQFLIMAVITGLCTFGIWISGAAEYPVLAGIGTGLLDALPVLGTGTVLTPWALILLLRKRYVPALILAATCAACVLTRELLEPRLIGRRLGVLPVVIFASLYAGVRIYGLRGLFLGPLSVLLIKELWKQVE